MKRIFVFSFLVLPVAVALFFCPLAGAEMVERLDRLNQDLDAIEKQAQEILKFQNEILAKIEALKIRVHRT